MADIDRLIGFMAIMQVPFMNDPDALAYIEEVKTVLKQAKAQEPGWISVKDAMPPERETIFAKFKGTAQWNPAMFATGSEDVRVVVQFEDGTRKVWHDNTMDGKWKCEREKCAYPKRTVTHWMPNPDLPKEG